MTTWSDVSRRAEKIGLWGWYGFRNCGDDALLLSLLSVMDTRSERQEVSVFGDRRNLENLLSRNRVRIVRRSAWNLFRFALTADVLIIGPGGLFPFANTPKLCLYAVITGVMRLRRKRIAYIGIGIGTMMFHSRRNLRLLNVITANASAFVSRSRNYLYYAPLLRTENVTLSCDMLFSDTTCPRYAREKEPDLVVIALADCFDGLPEACKSRFLEEFVLFARHIVGRGYHIRLIPFTNQRDQSLHDFVAAQIRDERVVSVPFHENPYETFAEISQGVLCVGMRFHAVVMALMNGTPCLSVAYSDKHQDIMERFGLERYSVPFEPVGNRYFPEKMPLDSHTLSAKFDALCRNQAQVQLQIESRLRKITSLSMKNREILVELLSRFSV